ncbi:hypothetical protein SYNPS1DRAFT_4016, partial [Syncephalis pseudoplumigaleata]
NHSCRPNCAVVFDGTQAIVRTLHAIEPGEELTINYIDVTLPRMVRQDELQKRYFFSCSCDGC